MFATIHAKERALERFGVELTPTVLETIGQKLKGLEASDYFVSSRRGTMWATVTVDGVEMRICYCPLRYIIITVVENTGEVYTKTQMKDHKRKQRMVRQNYYREERRAY